MHSFNAIWMSCTLLLLTAAGCSQSKTYEKHKDIAYDSLGHVREGYYSFNKDYIDALTDDLDACYGKKKL